MPGASALQKRTPLVRPDDPRYHSLGKGFLQLIAESRVNPGNVPCIFGQSFSGLCTVIPSVSSSHVVLVFANINNKNNLGEWAGDSTVTVSTSLEYLATPTYVVGSFTGERRGRMSPGALLFSDPIPFDMIAGVAARAVTNMQTTGSNLGVPAGFFPMGGTGPGSCGNFDAVTPDAVTANGATGLGSVTNVGHSGSPGVVAILGYVTTPSPTASVGGDSIAAGSGDSGFNSGDGGYLVRALTGQLNLAYTYPITPPVPFVRQAKAGESLLQYLTQASSLNGGYTTYSSVRAQIHELASTHICQYGIHDLTTLATLQANYITYANTFLRKGKHFVACTLIPQTTSTDCFATVTNQTQASTEANRQAFNTWLRNGTFAAATIAPSMCAVFDAAAPVEVNSSGVLATNGGYWKPSVSGVIASGTLTAVGATNAAELYTDSSKTWTQDQHRGYMLKMTSGAASGQMTGIFCNTPTAITAGVFSPLPSIGDTYQVIHSYTADGTHPSSEGAVAIAATLDLGLVK